MAEMRSLEFNEKNNLIRVLAEARTGAYEKAVELHDRSTEMERNGEIGFTILDNEAEQYEILADLTDTFIELICQDRLIIKDERNRGNDC